MFESGINEVSENTVRNDDHQEMEDDVQPPSRSCSERLKEWRRSERGRAIAKDLAIRKSLGEYYLAYWVAEINLMLACLGIFILFPTLAGLGTVAVGLLFVERLEQMHAVRGGYVGRKW